MAVLGDRYLELTTTNRTKLKDFGISEAENKEPDLSRTYVKISGVYVKATDLRYKTKVKGRDTLVAPKTFDELSEKLSAGDLVKSDGSTFTPDSLIPFYDLVKTPEKHETIRHNSGTSIQYGLKRTFKVVETTAGTSGDFLYVQIKTADGSRWEYVKKDELIYNSSAGVKNYNDAVSAASAGGPAVDSLSFTVGGESVLTIYTGSEYNLGDLLETERVNLTATYDAAGTPPYTRTTVSFDSSSGSVVETVTSTTKISAVISSQEYVQVEEEIMGEKEKVSKIKVTNYQVAPVSADEPYVILNIDGANVKVNRSEIRDLSGHEIADISTMVGQMVKYKDTSVTPPEWKQSAALTKENAVTVFPGGKYVTLTVNGHATMVERAIVRDLNEEEILDLTTMVGKPVQYKIGDKTFVSSPLTFEQAHMTYDTVKTYQEVQTEPTEDTCLRLKNGKYVKELETVQPISYREKESTETDYDAVLIEQTVGGTKKYVIINKKHYETGLDASFDPNKVVFLRRCDFNSSKCAVIQTTSKGKLADDAVEQCEIVKSGITDKAGTSLDKSTLTKRQIYDGFLTGYKQGEYKVADVYVDGTLQEIAEVGRRYQLTDVSYQEDYADSLSDYDCVRASDLRIDKNGDLVGGVKYDVGKANKKAFKTVWNIFKAATGPVVLAGIFIPVVGAIALATYAGLVATVPLAIPIFNRIKGWILNRKKEEFPDKTEENRKQEEKEIKEDLDKLLEDAKNTSYDLTQEQFEDRYAAIMDRILMNSQTTCNNSLFAVGDEFKVNPNNANISKKVRVELQKVLTDLKKCNRDLENAKTAFEKIKEDMSKKYPGKDSSLWSPADRKKYTDAEEKYKELFDEQGRLEGEKSRILNTVYGESYGIDARLETLQHRAEALKLFTYLSKWPSKVPVAAALGTRLVIDVEKGKITIDGHDVFKPRASSVTITDWNALQAEMQKLRETKLPEPVAEPVAAKIDAIAAVETSVEEFTAEKTKVVDLSRSAEITDADIKSKISLKIASLEGDVTNAYSIATTDGKTVAEIEAETRTIREKTEFAKAILGIKDVVIANQENEVALTAVNGLMTGTSAIVGYYNSHVKSFLAGRISHANSMIKSALTKPTALEFNAYLDSVKEEVNKTKARIEISKLYDKAAKLSDELAASTTIKAEKKPRIQNEINKIPTIINSSFTASNVTEIEAKKNQATAKIAEVEDMMKKSKTKTKKKADVIGQESLMKVLKEARKQARMVAAGTATEHHEMYKHIQTATGWDDAKIMAVLDKVIPKIAECIALSEPKEAVKVMRGDNKMFLTLAGDYLNTHPDLVHVTAVDTSTASV